MKLEINDDTITTFDSDGEKKSYNIGTPEAFELISKAWLRSGWDTKYVYGFSWMGRPVIQLPEDMIRIQEIIYQVRPEVVVETGVAHGGSLIFYASLFRAMKFGRVVGVDIEIRPHNRKAIEEHELTDLIDLVEGSSIDPDIVKSVHQHCAGSSATLVILDSNHLKDHVLAELHAYADLVTPDSYIVACDGIMKQMVGAPRSSPDWNVNNPQTAVQEFLKERKDFQLVEPDFPFNEGTISRRVTYWPNAFLKKTSAK